MNRIALIVSLLAVSSVAHAEDVLRPFKQDEKWGYKDPRGNVVVEPKYDKARSFSCGLAAVNVGAERELSGPPMKTGGKWGYIDASGAVVIPIKYDFGQDFSEDLAQVWVGTRPSFIDTKGKTVIDLGDVDRLHSVDDFSEGLAPVHLHSTLKGKPDYYETRYLDRQGKTVLTISGYGEEFHEGLAQFTVLNPKAEDEMPHEDLLSGFIDRRGKIVIQPTFAEVGDFSDGLAPVRLEKTEGVWGMGDRWGYIDKTGKCVIEPRFNEAHEFRNGVARAHSGGELRQFFFHSPPIWDGGEWLLIDKTGKVLKRTEEMPDYPDVPRERSNKHEE